MTTKPTAAAPISTTPPSPAAVRDELERVIAGPIFAQSDRLVSFLRFIVNETLDGRADQIKESIVGIEVFGRAAGYDPKVDPIVRVQARQLRQKLRDHYDRAGLDDTLIIDLPKGGYVPQFRHKHPAGTSAAVAPVLASHRVARVRAVTVAAVIALVVAAASIELYRRAGGRVSATSLPRSIAVLPFKNLTGDTAQEYLSDALTESLITEVSKLGALRVVSRGSASTFKGKAVDPRESGRALGVAALLEGSVRKNGDAVRVDVRLVSASNGEVLWASDTVERVPDDLFIIEDQIACDVTAALTGKPCTRNTDVDRGTHDLEAYRSYLRGRFHVQSQYAEAEPERALQTAAAHFRQAIERDPQFAAAHAGLADAYTQLVWFSPGDVQALLAQAKGAALKAVELNDRLAEAHTSLSAVYLHQWDFAAAGRAIERAVRLAPSSAWTRHEYSTYLMALGRTDAGLAEMRKAEELDPLNATIVADRGNTLLAAHRYEEALAQYRRACELELTCAPSAAVGAVYLLMGKYSEGIAELHQAQEHGAAAVDTTIWLAIGYGRAGRTHDAEQLLAEVKRLSKSQYIPRMFFAFIHSALGRHDEAFEELERAYRDREIGLAQIRLTVWLDPLRQDPRFSNLVRRVGVPD